MVILSPHLDDAVLSCWHLLAGPGDVTVINIFDGVPPPGTPLPWWDSITGATDPRSRMRERHDEDRAARAEAGRKAIGLGLLDAQYRAEAPPLATLVGRLEDHVEPGAVVFAPAAVDENHLDHALVRDAAIELARRGRRLRLYADLPHAIRLGWPGWVSGEPDEADVSSVWAATLAAPGLAVPRLVPRVHLLGAHARRRKLGALAHYRTQLEALDLFGFLPLEDPRALAYEVTWEVPQDALPSRDGREQARREPLVTDVPGEPLDDCA
jgi:LmbE family N-acetylglucosaminyl deacetylase